ncbi:MAG: FAD-dependent oxidoreductase [Thermoplasmata archaeon]
MGEIELPQKLIDDDTGRMLKERFKALKNEVNLLLFLHPLTEDRGARKKKKNEQTADLTGKDDDAGAVAETVFSKLTYMFVKELADIEPRIKYSVYELNSEAAKKYKVSRVPTILIEPEKYKIRFTGAPAGQESKTLIEAIIMVSTGDAKLPPEVIRQLEGIKEKRDVQVFVSLSCPYCPAQVMHAVRAAVAVPKLFSAEMVECAENPDLCEMYGVGGVPHTVMNGVTVSTGLQPFELFMIDLATLIPLEEKRKMIEKQKAEEARKAAVSLTEGGEKVLADVDFAIIGGGPAGLAAAIYGGRAGLKTILLEKDTLGGLVALTPQVENYPGFSKIGGLALMESMGEQARKYARIEIGLEAQEVRVGKRIEIITSAGKIITNALLFATGTKHKKLNVKGEDEYYGRGVSYCAQCDAYIYRGKRVFIIGGGNTGMTDALYLKGLQADVTIIQNLNHLTGEKYLQDAIGKEGIPVRYNHQVLEIFGKNGKVSGIRLKETTGDTIRTYEEVCDAVFIAIGWLPNSKLAQDIGVKCDQYGFIKVDSRQRTNIPRIYAAGDVTGGVMQIVTATSEGSVAALSAYEDLKKPYWIDEGKDCKC